MNGNQGGGLLNRTSELVEEILRTLPRPLTIDVTDDVLYAIETQLEQWPRKVFMFSDGYTPARGP